MTKLVAAGLLFGCLSASACGSPPSQSTPRQCDVRLASREPFEFDPATAASRPEPESQLVVHAKTSLAPLAEAVEARLPSHLTDGRVSLGPAGYAEYSAERGAVALSVTRTALVVEVPVHARAQACRGAGCYASCEPEATARAEIPLMLTADYRFRSSALSLSFTRGCRVRTLGGLLTIDVTPTLQAQLAPELAQLARRLDAQLPDIRPQLEQAWSELVAPRPLPFAGCFRLQPSAVVQGPFVPSTTTLSGRFAIRARPELQQRCDVNAPSPPLPALLSDGALPDQAQVFLGMRSPLSELQRALETGPALLVGGKSVQVSEARVRAWGSDVGVEVTLAGEVCGALAFSARPAFDDQGELLGLQDATLTPAERARLRERELDADALLQALLARVRWAPPLSSRGFRDAAPALARAASQPHLSVSARVDSARGTAANARGEELVAWLEARGELWVERR